MNESNGAQSEAVDDELAMLARSLADQARALRQRYEELAAIVDDLVGRERDATGPFELEDSWT